MTERNIVLLVGNCQSRSIAQFFEATPGFSAEYKTAYFRNYQAIYKGGQQEANRDRALLHAFVAENRSRIKTFIRQKTHGWFDDGLTPKEFAMGTDYIEYPALLLNYIWPLIPHGAHRFDANDIQKQRFPFSIMDAEVVRLKREGVPEHELIDRYLEIDVVRKYRIDRLRALNEIKATELDAMSSFSMWPFISEQMRDVQMFRTENHPNGPAFGRLLQEIGRRTKAIPDRQAWDARVEAARDGFGIMHIEAPIHPQVAEHFDLQWAKDKRFDFWGLMSLSFEDYLLKIYRYDCEEEYWYARAALMAKNFDEADAQIALALKRHPDLPAFQTMKVRVRRTRLMHEKHHQAPGALVALSASRLTRRLRAFAEGLAGFRSDTPCPWPIAEVYNTMLVLCRAECGPDPVIRTLRPLATRPDVDGHAIADESVGTVLTLTWQMTSALEGCSVPRI